MLAREPGRDYGQAGEERVRQLLDDCRHEPWPNVLERTLRPVPEFVRLLERFVSPCRAGWWPLLALEPSGRVLDFGCGWGALTFSLAPHAGLVVGCDLNPDRLRFIRARAAQDRVCNLQLVCAGDAPRLPFADREFDLVVVNGTLELLAASRRGDPREIYRSFLREVARVLKPKGQLLLAVQNRWAWRYLRGNPEDHTKLRFISLLPRSLANAYARKKIGRPYREHSFSIRGYRRLLDSSGFSAVQVSIPLPEFQVFGALVDPADRETVKSFFAERKPSWLEPLELEIRAWLASPLATSFCWIASREPAPPSLLQLVGKQIAAELYGQPESEIRWRKFRISRREVITCEVSLGRGLPNAIVKFPLSARAAARLDQEYAILGRLRELPAFVQGWPEIPRALLHGELRGTPFYVHEALPGLPGTRCVRLGRYKDQWRRISLDFILRLHSACRVDAELDEAVWHKAYLPLIEDAIAGVARLTGIPAEAFCEYLLRHLLGHPIPLVLYHGDYHPGNLLCSPRGEKLTGVIDWDGARQNSIPLIDLLDALISGRAEVDGSTTGTVLAEVIRNGLHAEDLKFVREYLEKMDFDLSPEQLQAFLLIDWLIRVAVRVRGQQAAWWSEVGWLEDNVQTFGLQLRDILGMRVVAS